jgi:hypothetical protein
LTIQAFFRRHPCSLDCGQRLERRKRFFLRNRKATDSMADELQAGTANERLIAIIEKPRIGCEGTKPD